MLFVLWEGALHRITRDLDLLGYGSPDIADLVSIIRDVCATRVQDDGLLFLADEVVGSLSRPPLLAEAIQATFQRRGTPLPAQPPLALTGTFTTDSTK